VVARQEGSSSGCVSWLALLVAVAALVLAWMAYQRSGGDLTSLVPSGAVHGRVPWERAGDSLGDAAASLGKQADLVAARTRLLARRNEVAAERNLEQVEKEVEGVRGRLAHTFGNASAEARAGWQEVDGELRRLEAQLREGGRGALETLDSVLRRLGARGDDAEEKGSAGGER